MDSILDSLVEVRISESQDFLKIRETLQRIGIPSKREKRLYQSCHIFHKRGRYWIVHFKEMFALDGKESSLTDEDVARRNRIVGLLEEWGLVTVVDQSQIQDPVAPMSQVKVIPYKEKGDWILETKYTMGVKK